MTVDKGSSKAFDQKALDKIVGNKRKEVPTQTEKGSGIVSEATKRTSLEISKEVYMEFKRLYLFKYDISLKTFVEDAMKEKIAEEKEKEE